LHLHKEYTVQKLWKNFQMRVEWAKPL